MRAIAAVVVLGLAFATAAASSVKLTIKPPTPRVVYFPRASEVVDASDLPTLEAMAHKLVRDASIRKVAVIGHASTDDAPTPIDRWTLSLARARVVVDRLVTFGAPRDRLVMRAYGSDRPADDRNQDFARAKNRRTELVIVDRDK